MKTVYPVIITEVTDDKTTPYLVYIPDFDIMTQGKSLCDAIYMAEDAISIMGIDDEDEGKKIAEPSRINDIDVAISPWHGEDNIVSEIKTLVPVDFDAYRKKLKYTSVRRNVTLPAWLDYEANKAGINVSSLLRTALITELDLLNRS